MVQESELPIHLPRKTRSGNITTYPLPRSTSILLQRTKNRNPATQHRRRILRSDSLGDFKHEMRIRTVIISISTITHLSIGIRTGKSIHGMLTMLFETILAFFAITLKTREGLSTHTDAVTDFDGRDFAADADGFTDDFVADADAGCGGINQ